MERKRFVRQSELGCDIHSQRELDEWLHKQTGEKSVPVYDGDGKTVVDTFTFGR